MFRQGSWSVAVLALLAVGVATSQVKSGPQGGQPDKKRAGDERPGTVKPGEPERPPAGLQFNVEGFLKDFDRDRDGSLSREELPQRLRHHFEQVDVDKDGKLNRDELSRGIVYLQQQRRPSDVVFILIEMSDCDEGCVGEVQHAYDVLRRLDKNQDGKIDPAELKAAREQLVRERVGGLIKELDADRDGRISKEEARGMIREDFAKLDTSRDGFLSHDELLRGAMAVPAGEKARPPQKDVAPPGRR
jgi:Ca2+-binding EF-hand superfamily protein